MNLILALTLSFSGSVEAQEPPELVCATRADVHELYPIISDLVAPARVRLDEGSRCLVLLGASDDVVRRTRELVRRIEARPPAPSPRVDLLCPAHLEAAALEPSARDVVGPEASVRADRATNCIILVGATADRSARVRRLVNDLDARAARRR